jgi:hypothetical protein
MQPIRQGDVIENLGLKPRPSLDGFSLKYKYVAIGHWETLNGHGGKVRLLW